jgi:RNA polymerase sigma-70 factor (ECF subfamily)
MGSWRLERALVERLHREAGASRWDLPVEVLEEALERSARRAFSEAPDATALARHARGLRLEDLALACACAQGHEGAWEHFIREFRPILYRAAGGIDPSGGARDLADALYGELFGLTERDGRRRSHFDYFHGRSSLATWLRAVLAQRHVDRVRESRRFAPLPEALADGDAGDGASAADGAALPAGGVDPEHARALALVRRALKAAVAALAPRERLRLRCYYARHLTLAEIGRALGEHEATVSRQIARARRTVRAAVEGDLRGQGLSAAEVAECLTSAAGDPGALDVADLLGPDAPRKAAAVARSEEETGPPTPRARVGKEGSV